MTSYFQILVSETEKVHFQSGGVCQSGWMTYCGRGKLQFFPRCPDAYPACHSNENEIRPRHESIQPHPTPSRLQQMF